MIKAFWRQPFFRQFVKELSFPLGHLPQLPAVPVHHVVLYRHVLRFPPRPVLLLGGVLVRVLCDEGVLWRDEPAGIIPFLLQPDFCSHTGGVWSGLQKLG